MQARPAAGAAAGPDSSVVDGNDVYWNNVPLESGKSFYPAFTFTINKSTAVKTKLKIWVQVTGGADMPETSTNFSITAVKKK